MVWLADLEYSNPRVVVGANTKPDFLLIAGAIELLTGLCSVYAEGTAGAPRIDVRELFKRIAFTMDRYLHDEFKRYHVLKAVLDFMSRHSGLLRPCFMPRVEEVLVWIMDLCKHKTREVRIRAWSAMSNFVQAVSVALLDNEDDGLDNTKRKHVCEFFVNTFLTRLRQNWSSNDDDTADDGPADTTAVGRGADTGAIMILRAVGYFAQPIQHFFGEDELRRGVKGLRGVLQELIDYTRLMLSPDVDLVATAGQAPEIESHLAYIMAALAKILTELPDVDDEVEEHLHSVTQKLLECFPNLNPTMKTENCDAFWRLLVGLGTQRPRAAERLIEIISTEGVILAVSRRESVGDPDQDQEIVTVHREHYTALFVTLLSRERWVKDSALEKTQSQLQAKIYEKLVGCILESMAKLDLRLVPTDENGDLSTGGGSLGEGDPTISAQAAPVLKPTVEQDFEVFLTLVDFCQELLPVCVPEMFLAWSVPFASAVIARLEHEPSAVQVSGYYKLLSIVCKICSAEHFFEGCQVAGMDTRATCRSMLLDHVKRTSVRLTQFKDELLIAAIQSVLCVPRPLLVDCVRDLQEPLRLGLGLGLSHTPLAHFVIGILEGWVDFSSSVLEIAENAAVADVGRALDSMWPLLLPMLNEYLYVSTDQSALNTDELTQLEELQTTKGATAAPEMENLSSDALRKRMLRFVGKIGGRAKAMMESEDADARSGHGGDRHGLMVWDCTEHVRLVLPSTSGKEPSVWLDSLFPRIVALAEDSSDRQTKVAACELLYGSILLCAAETREESSKHDVFKHLFPALLRLSVDGDMVTRKMFEPLLKQMVTWFTIGKNSDKADGELLLNAIMEAMCHPTESVLRDAAAKALAEFLTWSLKQRVVSDLTKSTPLQTGKLLEKLFGHANHPDPYKRMGSALAFNHIYRLFRERQELVIKYVFKFIREYFKSLKLSHLDADVLDASALTLKVLAHLQKIVELNIANIMNNSQCYKDMSKEAMPDLLRRTGEFKDTPTAYRQMSADMYFSFVKVMSDEESDGQKYTPRTYLVEGEYISEEGDGECSTRV